MSETPRRLPHLRLDTPCDKRWEDLTGDGEQVRFCSSCEKRVFNLSTMTAAQGEALLARKRAGVCVSYEPGPDGSPLSSDQRRQHLPPQSSGVALAAAALMALSVACGPSEETREEKSARIEVELAESRIQDEVRHGQERIEVLRAAENRKATESKYDPSEMGGARYRPPPRNPWCRPAGKKYAKGAKIRVVVRGEKSALMPAHSLPVCPQHTHTGGCCDPNDPLCGL